MSEKPESKCFFETTYIVKVLSPDKPCLLGSLYQVLGGEQEFAWSVTSKIKTVKAIPRKRFAQKLFHKHKVNPERFGLTLDGIEIPE